MSQRTQTALPARSLQRKRQMLWIMGGSTMAAMGLTAAWLSLGPGNAGPLLLSVQQLRADELTAVPSLIESVHASSYVPGATFISRTAEAPQLADAGQLPATAPLFDAAVAGAAAEQSPSQFEDDGQVRYFNGRPVRPARTITMVVTAYSPDEQSCGDSADGITASGYSVWTNGMKLVAADTDVLPFGTLLSVPGYDNASIVPVLDRGGAIKGNRLDVLYPTHEEALEWGVQELEVTVWEYADGLPNGFREDHRRAGS